MEEQLNSILSQTCLPDELIVVDDNSTDHTVEILRSFCEKYPIVHLHQNAKQLGAVKNFEKAMLLAKNELIAISDQDDIWHPQKLEKLLFNFSENSLLIYCNSVRFTNKADFNVKPNPKYVRFHGRDGRKIFLFNTISGHAMLLRRKLFELARPFTNEVMYDWWMGIIAAYNGGVDYVAETLVLQRVHGSNLSINEKYDYGNSVNRNKFKQMVLEHLYQFTKTPSMPDDHKKFIEKLFFLWKDARNKKYSLRLFFFLMKHRKVLFAFKKKKLVFFSNLKYSWWFSTN